VRFVQTLVQGMMGLDIIRDLQSKA
jgi:hypothetical protein